MDVTHRAGNSFCFFNPDGIALISTADTLYRTSPPAKLNLFLEILGRRDDGFHELDTVMVAIDWRDELQLQLKPTPGIELSVDWLPDRTAIAEELGVGVSDALLDVPTDGSNLVHRALELVNDETGYTAGWKVQLGKRIPSGAGMGGASSDAAATLRLAKCALQNSDPDLASTLTDEKLTQMAAQLGSDVPFFLGDTRADISHDSESDPSRERFGSLARALGRGEKLSFHELPVTHRFLVIYPPIALSTAAVYSRATVSANPKSGLDAIKTFIRPSPIPTAGILYNALADPASGLSPHVNEALECLRQSKARWSPKPQQDSHCQMTGSGSACFAWLTPDEMSADTAPGSATDATSASDVAKTRELSAFVREQLSGGALVKVVATCSAAPEIQIA
ncbi:4-(cytidine 5'-diphospho)-2-C-methyl-D-erythritol kinase [Rhodopirellula sp. SWK7]|uniref:4-(cytidine 5'-diphospho)-2-C-methyl-D-erythritol kinase n=1 Tax=Rhodopirellula sp. SWK7 TaxID=595460 RepID=UPI0002BFD30D|nr:4-diphosphocytidyl-2C-methyl-D-erythritol kinase [Rhodopirellula sp. SWK7]EMI43255.1 4-diphosphocytidyl-2-C-methyl-D-erythritol kinase [Rhodopirellula sp. SWK7]